MSELMTSEEFLEHYGIKGMSPAYLANVGESVSVYWK